jgi:DNA integrity scanning protein DisA with diadenylate cyclase activity
MPTDVAIEQPDQPFDPRGITVHSRIREGVAEWADELALEFMDVEGVTFQNDGGTDLFVTDKNHTEPVDAEGWLNDLSDQLDQDRLDFTPMQVLIGRISHHAYEAALEARNG